MIDILEVYRVVSGIDTKVASIASDDAILANGIMSKNEVSVTVVTDTIPDIQEGDFIRVGGIKYKINRASEFADKSSVNHTTTYLFEAPEYTLIDKILTNKITKSVRVTLTGKLRDWLELLIWNVNKTNDNPLGVDTGWQLGNIPDTEYMTLSFDGIDCRSLLSELASAYGYEYYVHDHTINYVSRIENERNLTFTQGQGGGLYEVEQSNVDSGDVTTRVYPVGGTKNMAPGEGDEEGRLMLPEKYLENFSETNRAVEKKIVFDDIHPSFTGFVENPTGENYREFICRDIDFNIDELAIGDDARINFLTGDLMGKPFEFKWDNSNKKITLIYQEDELAPIDPETQSRPLIPSTAKHLRGGEEFNFTGIRLGEAYKQAAISKLREKATDWLAFNSQKRVKFTLDVDYRYMREKGGLECGDLITVSIPSRNISRIIRIVSTEKNLKTGKLSCVVSNYLTEKWEDKIEGQISSMQATINGGGGNGSVTVLEKYDERPFTDKNVLSSLRTLKEIAENAVSKKLNDTAAGLITFLKGIKLGDFVQGKSGANIDDLGNAEFLTAVIRELLRSTKFVDGLIGEGWQIWIDQLTGLSHLTIDKATIRQSLVALELLIQKVRSIGGQFIVSAANGKIKDVIRQGNNYRILFEQECDFMVHDLMRCAVTSGASRKAYWVEITSADVNGVTVPVSEFGGVAPTVGDECVLMGNTENKLRQNLISISATEDGQPRIDILDGVKAKNFNGCLRCRFGNLDGIKDSSFPADKQPKGNGLYGDNVYLKGTFVLMTGEDILTRFEITEGKIHSAVEGLRKEIREEQSYLDNSSFADGMDKWKTGSKATLFTLGGRWIWANGGPYGTKPDGHAEIRTDGKVPYAYIRNSYIMQKLEDFRLVPEYRQTNSQGERVPGVVYLSFSYRVVKAGRLKIEFVGADKTGFENFNLFGHEEDLPVGGEKMFTLDGLWNGTGDFKLSFTGVIYISLLVFSTNKADALAYKYRTLFEQSDRLVKISAAVFDKDGEALKETGLVVKPEGSGIYMQTADGKLALIGVGLEEEDEYGNTRTVVKLTGDNIRLEGDLTANGTFHVDEDGAVHANKGTIGAFSMNGYWLENTDGRSAAVSIKSYHMEYGNDGKETKVLDNEASLGNTLPASAGVQTNAMFKSIGKDTNGNAAVILQARNCTQNIWAGGRANLAVDAEGGCRWRMNEGDHWCMPGFLLWLHIDVSRDFKVTTQTFGHGLEMYRVNIVANENNQRGQNYVYVYFYCKHDRVRISAISEGQDWEESGKWGLTPCCEGIQTDKVESNGLTIKKAIFTFWKGSDKFVPNHATLFFFGEPSDGLEY